MLKTYKRKRLVSELQLVLTLLFVVALVVSNIITSKQVLLPFNITMTGAVFIFPITYIFIRPCVRGLRIPMEPLDMLLRFRS